MSKNPNAKPEKTTDQLLAELRMCAAKADEHERQEKKAAIEAGEALYELRSSLDRLAYGKIVKPIVGMKTAGRLITRYLASVAADGSGGGR